MDQFLTLFLVFLGIIFTQNIILAQFLGICPFVGVSKDVSSAFGMGMAVTFVMVIASLVTWVLSWYILLPLKLSHLTTIVFILVIASLVQFVEMAIAKLAPALYKSLGIYLPLITTNCAVLGIAIINYKTFLDVNGATAFMSLMYSMANGIGGGISFTLAIIPMAAIRERLEITKVPQPLKGLPIAFICAGMMALAFQGFINLIKIPPNLF